MTASRQNVSGCYVCSILPHAVSQPHLYATPLPLTEAMGAVNESMNQPTDQAHHTRLSALDGTGTLGLRVIVQNAHLIHCDRTNNNTSCFPVCVKLTGAATVPSVDVDHCNVTIPIPGGQNMTTLEGIWWLCGGRAYLRLPTNTSAVCTPVTVSDHTYIITAHPRTDSGDKRNTRRKRFVTFEPHDPIWGSNVPWEHRNFQVRL